MDSTAADREHFVEIILREGRVKHAVKTALACSLATLLSFYFHLPATQMAPVYCFVLMTLGMPSPRVNWLMSVVTIAISNIVCGLILVVCHNAPALYLTATLLWLLLCVLFTNWFPVPALLALLSSTVGLFTSLEEKPIGTTLDYFVGNMGSFLAGGFSMAVVYTLFWPSGVQKTFLQRLVEVYARLENDCRQTARQIRTGAVPHSDAALEDWAPFRPLRKLIATGHHRPGTSADPFVRMIQGCRNLNLRLWFFNHAIAPAATVQISEEGRRRLAAILEQCADHLRALTECVSRRQPVPSIPVKLLDDANFAKSPHPPAAPASDLMLAHGVHRVVLHRLVDDLKTVTDVQSAVLAALRGELHGELLAVKAFAVGKQLIDVNVVRIGVKLVVIVLLLLAAVILLGLPGGTQVAFFAAFFGSTANLGRQTKTNVIGIAGLVSGFAFGVVAALITSQLPNFPLLLAFVFLGEFLASLFFQSLPRYGVAGLQAGLAIPFSYLAATGPEWGSFSAVSTRLGALVVAGATAVLVHAYLWPVLPMRQLRTAIAAAMRDTARSLRELFATHTTWKGPPASLGDILHQAQDLLDDARYLPGADHADPAYNRVLAALLEIDGYLEQVHLILNLDSESVVRDRFFQSASEYAEQAQSNLECVAQQFHPVVKRAARLQLQPWTTHEASRWEEISRSIAPTNPQQSEELRRQLVIADCFDRIAEAVTRISRIAVEINCLATSK